MTQEALRMALEVLERSDCLGYQANLKAITAIKEALAQTQEPVAYLVLFEGAGKLLEFKKGNYIHGAKVEHIPLYTTPPQRTWVGLTVNEIALINADYPLPQGFALALQAKLKEKNT